jgi:hypothetical protein
MAGRRMKNLRSFSRMLTLLPWSWELTDGAVDVDGEGGTADSRSLALPRNFILSEVVRFTLEAAPALTFLAGSCSVDTCCCADVTAFRRMAASSDSAWRRVSWNRFDELGVNFYIKFFFCLQIGDFYSKCSFLKQELSIKFVFEKMAFFRRK